MSKNIGNYHLFKRNGAYFVYDFVHNLFLVSKKEEDFKKLERVLIDFSEKRNLSDDVRQKYQLILDNYQENFDIYDTKKHLNKDNAVSGRITLMISQACNLRCKYCYGSDGKFGTTGEFMSKATAEQSIRYLVQKAAKVTNYFFVTFLGGEPLLNFDLMKHTIEYAKANYPDKEFTYTFTTNATLFTQEIIDYLKGVNISIMISLDGMDFIHNANRVFANGKGSFDCVMKNIDLLKKNNVPFYVRSTLADEYSAYYEDITNFFKDIGASQIYISHLDKYNIDSDEFDIDVDKLKSDKSYVTAYYEKIKLKILETGILPSAVPFFAVLKKIHEASRSMISCGVANGCTAVAYNGDFYPCHRFVGINGFAFGNVYEGINDNELNNIATSLDKATIKCNSCWCKYICQRGCIRNIAKNNGSFISYSDDFCKLQEEYIERNLETYYEIQKKRPELLKQISEKEIEVYNIV